MRKELLLKLIACIEYFKGYIYKLINDSKCNLHSPEVLKVSSMLNDLIEIYYLI